MKTSVLALLLLSLASPGWAQEPAPGVDKAEALMRALSTDQFFLAGVGSALRKSVTEGELQQSEFDCVMAADYTFVRNAYVGIAVHTLTAKEVDDALAFFQSSAGKLTLAMAWEMARKAYPDLKGGPDPRDALRVPSTAEQKQMEQYVGSGLADKVNAVSSQPKLEGVEGELQRILMECRQQP